MGASTKARLFKETGASSLQPVQRVEPMEGRKMLTLKSHQHHAQSWMDRLKVVAILCLALLPAFSAAAADADYFKGKTLTIMVGSKAGGGTDTTARLVAQHWADHIPGNPTIRIRNVPLSSAAGNMIQENTRPDGLTVGVFAGGGTLGPVARKSAQVKYDPLEWGIVGSIERGPTVLLIRKSALDRLKDPKAKPVAMGSVSTDRPQDAMALYGAEYLDWNLKFVLGYPASKEMYLAFERGEIDMFGSGTGKILERFIGSGEAVPLAADELRKDYPSVPVFEKLLEQHGKKPSGLDWRTFQAWTGPSGVDKFFVTPPGTPDHVLQTLQQSFIALEKDPEFNEQADKILGSAAIVVPGEKTKKMIRAALVVDPDVRQRAHELRMKYGLPPVSDLE